MFYLTYARRELRRRSWRTGLASATTALATATIISVYALAAGLTSADQQVLHPLGSVGSNLLVTRDVSAALEALKTGPDGSASSDAARSELQEILDENDQAARTDLSKLGAPNQHFAHDFFLPGNQLTFPVDVARQISNVDGVRSTSAGLILIVEHQEGTVPQIVATFKTGGQTVTIDQNIAPPTAAEIQATQACIANLQNNLGTVATETPGKSVPAQLNPDDIANCYPERLRHFHATVVTPQQTITQVVSPPQTDIRTTSSTIAGVDPTAGQGFLTARQVSVGSYLATSSDAVLNESYAGQHGLGIGSHITLNGATLNVVGLARPALGIPNADVYVQLASLQKISGFDHRVNAVFVRIAASNRLGAIAAAIGRQFPGMLATGDDVLARTVNSSVQNASALARAARLILAMIAMTVACALTALLTTGSVRSRVREIGTLRAIGWSRFAVVRQVMLESLCQSMFGLVAGLAASVAAIQALSTITLRYSAPQLFTTQVLGLGSAGSSGVTGALTLHAPADQTGILFGVAAAIGAGLLSGAVAALLAARLRPMQALRELG